MSNDHSESQSNHRKFLPWNIDAVFEHNLFTKLVIAFAIIGFLTLLFYAVAYALVNPGFWFAIFLLLFGTLSINGNPVGSAFYIPLVPILLFACVYAIFCYYLIAVLWNSHLLVRKLIRQAFQS
jgi:hypothetical protein